MSPAPDASTGRSRSFRVHGAVLAVHIDGERQPTVVCEAGLTDWSLTWSPVLPLLGPQRACTYDRAGLGESGERDRPPTVEGMVDDLRALLAAAGERPPYLLVGQSFGGVLVARFAARYPDEVTGMVLVDAAQSGQLLHVDEDLRRMRLAVLADEAEGLRAWAREAQAGGSPDRRRLPVMTPDRALGARYRAYLHGHPRALLTMADEIDLFRNVIVEPERPRDLGDMPLVVLTRGRPAAWVARGSPTSDDGLARYEDAWSGLQRRLATSSTRARQVIVPDAGHNIHHERPDVVAAAVLEVAALRAG